jgi:hypothetical protein
LSGMLCGGSCVNTDWNCWLRMFVFFKPTRNERTLDLLLMNNPSNLNKLCTLPPIGLADHDNVYAEINTWLKRVRETRICFV